MLLLTFASAYFFPPLQSVLRNVSLWTDYFLRWSVVPSTPRLPHSLATFMYSKGTQKTCPLQETIPEEDSEDLHLPSMVGNTDFWQAAYRQERQARIQLEKRLKRLEEKLQQLSDPDALRTVRESLLEPLTPSNEGSDDAQPPADLVDDTDLVDPEVVVLDGVTGQVEDVTPRNDNATVSKEDDPEAYEQFDDQLGIPRDGSPVNRSDSVASDV